VSPAPGVCASCGGFRRVPQIGQCPARIDGGAELHRGHTLLLERASRGQCVRRLGLFSNEVSESCKRRPLIALVTITNLVTGDLNGDGVLDQNELNTVLSNYFPTSRGCL